MPTSAEISATFNFTQVDHETEHLLGTPRWNRPVTLTWTINILHEFKVLFGHCVAVSYSVEKDLDGLKEVPGELWPECTVTTGSLIVSVVSNSPEFWSANAIAILVTVLKIGPGLAGLPQRIRERWYLDAARAEKARQALEILQAARTEMVEIRHRPINAGQVEITPEPPDNSWTLDS